MQKNILHWEYAPFWYKKVLDTFGFDQNRDRKARDLLYSYRKNFDIEPLVNTLSEKISSPGISEIFILGAGPNLEEHLNSVISDLISNREKYFIASADGATRALLERGQLPDVVFSDLDGLTEADLARLVDHNIPLVIHAHGDNIDKIEVITDILSTYHYIIGTTQTEPRYPIINPGGFTDGDRAVVFLHHICDGGKVFRLLGFAYGNRIGKYSKPKYERAQEMNEFKRKKLMICKHIISCIREKYAREVIYMNFNNHK